MVKEGEEAPDFTLPGGDARKVALSALRGRKVVVYFYPKDDTPGCTIEAMDFTALREDFAKAGVEIIGISKDSCESHAKFAKKRKLGITLLSDEDASVQKKYGVWRPKRFMGREFLGTARVTFLIDEKGMIKRIWDPVEPKGHAREVLEAAKAL